VARGELDAARPHYIDDLTCNLIRGRAAQRLVELGDTAGLEPLIEFLRTIPGELVHERTDTASTWQHAGTALGTLGQLALEPMLAAYARADSNAGRVTLAWALSQLRDVRDD